MNILILGDVFGPPGMRAIKEKLPTLGVCRGMQSIQNYFGNDIIKIKNHVKKTHILNIVGNSRIEKLLKKYNKVNSFHEYGSNKTSKDIVALAKSDDDIVEAIKLSRFFLRNNS